MYSVNSLDQTISEFKSKSFLAIKILTLAIKEGFIYKNLEWCKASYIKN